MTSNETSSEYRVLAMELLRTLRGRRSQTAFSRRLGYRSNVVQRWESGHSLPTATTFLACCKKLNLDVVAALERYYGRRPDWLKQHAIDSAQGVAAFLRDQRGNVPLKELADRVGTNRYTLSRWLSGQAHPRLHELLAVIDASSHRLLDFVAGLVDPARLPSVAEPWNRLQRAREAAYATPWSHAVLRALELSTPHRPPGGTVSWLATTLGLEPPVLREALAALVDAGQVQKRRGRYFPTGTGHVDTGRDPVRARALKVHWTRAALARLEAGSPGLFGYLLFSVSRHDLRRLREVQLQYVRQIHAIIAESQSEDCVALFCTQLVDLSTAPDNALSEGV